MTPVWAQLGYLAAAVCFIVALKGLSSPRTARRGNLIGAAGAVLACVIVFAAGDLDHSAADPGRDRHRHRDRGGRRLPGADDPDAPAGRPVQRRRRRGRGHRRAGRAGHVLDRLPVNDVATPSPPVFRPGHHRLHHRGRVGQLRRLDRHVPQAAGADDHPAGHLRRLSRSCTGSACWPAVGFARRPGPGPQPGRSACCWPSSGPGSACCWSCRSAAPTCRSSSRC